MTKMRPSRSFPLYTATLLLVWIVGIGGAAAETLPRGNPTTIADSGLQTPAPSGRIVVKLVDDGGLETAAGALVAKRAEAGADADRLARLAGSLAPGSRWTPRFALARERLIALRAAARHRSGAPRTDLTAYVELEARGLGRGEMLELVAKLAADPAVETAFLEPVAVPASLGFDAFGGADGGKPLHPPLGTHIPVEIGSDTPDFTDLQGYLGAAPTGVGALEVRDEPGGRGAGVRVIDVEGAWLWAHEDMPVPFADLNEHVDIYGWRQHGTAVLGVIRGVDNGYGVTGIAPDSEVGASSIAGTNAASAILAAVDVLSEGDVILIELHAPGPNATGAGQVGYIPIEFWLDNFDAMQLATTLGITVVEAAGNGQEDLDDPVYQGLFDRSVRDSGAILIGASSGDELDAAWFTNHGSRLDLHGWGFYVVTCGYGTLQGYPMPEERYYSDSFNGTSSASPIVVGAVVNLQAMAREIYGFSLNARLVRDILRQTGTPQEPGNLIGPRPNLPPALALAAAGIGELVGTIRDAVTDLPVAGVTVVVGEEGAFDITDETGGFRLSLLVGDYDLSFSSFFYETDGAMATVVKRETTVLNVALNPLPRVDVSGTVTGAGAPLANTHVLPLDVPVPATTSGPDGSFVLAEVPQGPEYVLRFDQTPGYGAVIATAPTAGGAPPPLAIEMPPILEDFETGPIYTATDGHWLHGTPPVSVPGAAFSGQKCWGIGMFEGNYPDEIVDTLVSTEYDLGEYAGQPLFLSFHFYSATESGFDGVHLRAAVTGSDDEILIPIDGYTDISMGGLDYDPGWSGETLGWRGTVFDISHLAGEAVTFAWVFGSDGSINGPGFFVDGIALASGTTVTAAPGTGPTPRVTAPALATFPNPFNPSTTVVWRVAEAGRLRLEIFDLRGSLLRTLVDGRVEAGAGQSTWDGRDTGGRRMPSGVYLLRLTAPDGSVAARRVLLAK